MSEFTKGEMIAMQNNLGLGHRGDIILTTQKRVDNNKEPIAKDIFNEAYAKELVRRWNSQPDLLEACKWSLEIIKTAENSVNKVLAKFGGEHLPKPPIEKIEAAIAKATHKP